MRLEQGKIDALAGLGETPAPERSEAELEAGARRFAERLDALRARRAEPRARVGRVAVLMAVAAASAAAAVLALQPRSNEEVPEPTLAAATALVELDATDERITRSVDDEGRERFVTADAGTAAIRMVSGARALLGPSSQAWCWSERAPAWLHLDIGQVDVSVPRLRMGQSLTIQTPNASVIVHGTAFTVQVVGSDPPITTVAVREGTVEVREGPSSTFVHAGEVWRSGMKGSAIPTTSATVAVAEAAPPPSGALVDRSPAPRTARSSEPSALASESSLARENALFREASQARQRGDFESSQATLAKLLTEFPRSPMRATALVERAFALSRLGRTTEAGAVAKQALSEGASEHVREQLWLIAFGTKPAPPAKGSSSASE